MPKSHIGTDEGHDNTNFHCPYSKILFKNSIPSAIYSWGGGGGYSHILAIQGCTTGKGMVFKPFGLV